MVCKKCSGNFLYLAYSGSQLGLYCRTCNTWLKWVGKNESGEMLKKYPLLDGVQDKVVTKKKTTVLKTCKKCGGSSFYEEKKAMHTGLYCSFCNTWLKWVKK